MNKKNVVIPQCQPTERGESYSTNILRPAISESINQGLLLWCVLWLSATIPLPLPPFENPLNCIESPFHSLCSPRLIVSKRHLIQTLLLLQPYLLRYSSQSYFIWLAVHQLALSKNTSNATLAQLFSSILSDADKLPSSFTSANDVPPQSG